jgi:hypothetical protein
MGCVSVQKKCLTEQGQVPMPDKKANNSHIDDNLEMNENLVMA